MKENRIKCLSWGFEQVSHLIHRYQDSCTPNIAVCSSKSTGCDAIRLVSLLNGLKLHDLYPFPEPPFADISLHSLAELLDAIDLPDCTEPPPQLGREVCNWCAQLGGRPCSTTCFPQCEAVTLRWISTTLKMDKAEASYYAWLESQKLRSIPPIQAVIDLV